MELWAGNERAHRSLNLGGIWESDVYRRALQAADSGGDLSAVFSCSGQISHAWSSRIASATAYTPSGVCPHVHHLLHEFQDIPKDTAGLLAALNDAFYALE